MNAENNLIFVSGKFNSGTGIYIPEYDFIITTNEVVKNSEKALVKYQKNLKTTAKVIFTDTVFNLAFLQNPFKIENSENLNFEKKYPISPNESYKVLYTNYFNEKLYKYFFVKQKNKNEVFFEFKTIFTEQTNGGLIVNNFDEIVGISLFLKNEKRQFIIPNFIIDKALKNFKKTNFEVALRCPYCKKIINKNAIVNNQCPNCKVKLPDEILGKKKLKKSKTALIIEEIIKEMNYDLDLCTLNENFWEINKGSATIFIRYSPEKQLITAFSLLTEIKNNHHQIFKFVLQENQKLKHISFALENNWLLLVSPYLYEEDFSINEGKKIFETLSNYADFYDDIIIKMQQK